MLQKLLERVLLKYFGTYLTGIDATNLHLGIWSGNILVERIGLNHRKINEILGKHLPCRILCSQVARFQLIIPWANLLSQSVQVLLDGVFVVLQADEQMSPQSAQQQFIEGKLLEIINYAQYLYGRTQQQPLTTGFTQDLLAKIINNLQVSVKNIHIRVQKPGQYSFGLTLFLVELYTCDKEGNRIFTENGKEERKSLYKKVALQSLKLYWDEGSQDKFEELPSERRIAAFTERIVRVQNPILDLNLSIRVSKATTSQNVIYSLQVKLSPLRLILNELQFKQMYDLQADIFKFKRQWRQLSKKQLQPQDSLRYKSLFMKRFMSVLQMSEETELNELESELMLMVPSKTLLGWSSEVVREHIVAEKSKEQKTFAAGLLSFLGLGKEPSISQEEKEKIRVFTKELIDEVKKNKSSRIYTLAFDFEKVSLQMNLARSEVFLYFQQFKLRLSQETEKKLLKVSFVLCGVCRPCDRAEFPFLGETNFKAEHKGEGANSRTKLDLEQLCLEVDQDVLSQFRSLIPIDQKIRSKLLDKEEVAQSTGGVLLLTVAKTWEVAELKVLTDELQVFREGKLTFRVYLPNCAVAEGANSEGAFQWHLYTWWGQFVFASKSVQTRSTWLKIVKGKILAPLAEDSIVRTLASPVSFKKEDKEGQAESVAPYKGVLVLTSAKLSALYRRRETALLSVSLVGLKVDSVEEFDKFDRKVQLGKLVIQDFTYNYPHPSDYSQFVTLDCGNSVHSGLSYDSKQTIVVQMRGLKPVPQNSEVWIKLSVAIDGVKVNIKPSLILNIALIIAEREQGKVIPQSQLNALLSSLVKGKALNRPVNNQLDWDKIIKNVEPLLRALQIQVKINYARINLINFEQHNSIGCLQGKAVDLKIMSGKSGILVDGRVQGLGLFEMCGYPKNIDDRQLYIQTKPFVLAKGEQDTLHFRYFSLDSLAEKQRYTSVVEVNVRKVRLTYLQQPLLRVIDYALSQLLPAVLQPFALLDYRQPPSAFKFKNDVTLTPERIKGCIKQALSPESLQVKVRVVDSQLYIPGEGQGMSVFFAELELWSQIKQVRDRIVITQQLIEKMYSEDFSRSQEVHDFVFEKVIRQHCEVVRYLLRIVGARLTTQWEQAQSGSEPFSFRLMIEMLGNDSLFSLLPFVKVDKRMKILGMSDLVRLRLSKTQYYAVIKALMTNILFDDGCEAHFVFEQRIRAKQAGTPFLIHIDFRQLFLTFADLEHQPLVLLKALRVEMIKEKEVRFHAMARELDVFANRESSELGSNFGWGFPPELNTQDYNMGSLPQKQNAFFYRSISAKDGSVTHKIALKGLFGQVNLPLLTAIGLWAVPVQECYPKTPPSDFPLLVADINLADSTLFLPPGEDNLTMGVRGGLNFMFVRHAGSPPVLLLDRVQDQVLKLGMAISYILELRQLGVVRGSPESIKRAQKSSILCDQLPIFLRMDSYLRVDREGKSYYDTNLECSFSKAHLRLPFTQVKWLIKYFGQKPKQPVDEQPPPQVIEPVPAVYHPESQYGVVVDSVLVQIFSSRGKPLLSLVTSLKLAANFRKDSTELEGESSLKASYFNSEIVCWQPFVEDLTLEFQYKHSKSTYVVLQSKKQVNLTLTTDFLAATRQISAEYAGLWQEESAALKEESRECFITIRNQTGLSLESCVEEQVVFMSHHEERLLPDHLMSKEGIEEGRYRHRNRFGFYLDNKESPTFLEGINIWSLSVRKQTVNGFPILVKPLLPPLRGLCFSSKYVLLNLTGLAVQVEMNGQRWRVQPSTDFGVPVWGLNQQIRFYYPHLSGTIESFGFQLESVRSQFEHEIRTAKGSFFTRLFLVEGECRVIKMLPVFTLRNCLPVSSQYRLTITHPGGKFERLGRLQVQEVLSLHQLSSNWMVDFRAMVMGFQECESCCLMKPGDVYPRLTTLNIDDIKNLRGSLELKIDVVEGVKRAAIYCKAFGVLEVPFPIIFAREEPMPGQELDIVSKVVMIENQRSFNLYLKDNPVAQHKVTNIALGDDDFSLKNSKGEHFELVCRQQIVAVDSGLQLFTRVYRILPRVVLANFLKGPIAVSVEEKTLVVQSEKRVVMVWPREECKRTIRVGIEGFKESGPVALRDNSSVPALVVSQNETSFRTLRVECVKKDSCSYVMVMEEEHPAYIIRNKLSMDFGLRVWQENCNFEIEIEGESRFGWQDPSQPFVLVCLLSFRSRLQNRFLETQIRLELLGQEDCHKLTVENPSNPDDQYEFYVTIFTQNLSKVVEFRSPEEEVLGDQAGQMSVMNVAVLICELGVSLVGGRGPVRQELSYLYLNRINLISNANKLVRKSQLKVGFINIDNNTKIEALFPVLLTPLLLQKSLQGNRPILFIYLEQNLNSQQLDILEAKLKVEPMCLRISESYILALKEFMWPSEGSKQESLPEGSLLQTLGFDPLSNHRAFHFERTVLEAGLVGGSIVRRFQIAALNLYISFKIEREGDKADITNLLTSFLGVNFISIEEAPINISSTKSDRINSFTQFYNIVFSKIKQAVIKGIFSVLGSFSLVGNPYSLVRYVALGSYELIERPISGFIRGPFQGVFGIGKGIFSFGKNISAGIFNSFELISGTIASGLVFASMDGLFRKRRERLCIEKPNHIFSGMLLGLRKLGVSGQSAVDGLYRLPSMERGALGKLKGLTKGLVGLVTKPIAGIFDGISSISHGVKKTFLYFDDGPNEIRKRPCRIFYGRERAIKFFDEKKEGVAQLLQKDKVDVTNIVQIYQLEQNRFILMSLQFLSLVDLRQGAVVWKLVTSFIGKVVLEGEQIQIQLKSGKRMQVQIQDSKLRQSLFSDLMEILDSIET